MSIYNHHMEIKQKKNSTLQRWHSSNFQKKDILVMSFFIISSDRGFKLFFYCIKISESSNYNFVIFLHFKPFDFFEEDFKFLFLVSSKIIDRLDFIKSRINLTYWHCNDLWIFSSVIWSIKNSDRSCLYYTTCEKWISSIKTYITRISVLWKRLRKKPVIEWIEHRVMNYSIKHKTSHFVIVFILIITPCWDIDYYIENSSFLICISCDIIYHIHHLSWEIEKIKIWL